MTPHALTAARLRSLSRLARAYAHEIRGASSALAIHTELLSRSVADVEDETVRARQQRYVGVLTQERQRIQGLVDVLLDALVPLDDPAVESFDLGEVLGRLHALLGPQSVERRAPVEVAPAGALPMTGRRGVVEQGLLDVLLWALDRVAKGGRVGVAVADEPERLRVVIDAGDGPGAASADGLGHCDAVLRLAGGSVRNDSGDGRVEVDLPRTAPAEGRQHA